MPFLRFSRDKRGYEHIYLMHAGSRRGKPGRARLLYWYRTPPGVKVGRVAFDEDIRRALEAQYPGVVFDWQTIANTPMPPPDAEPWRERRRQERAARQVRMAEEADAPSEIGADEQPADASDELAATAEGIESQVDRWPTPDFIANDSDADSNELDEGGAGEDEGPVADAAVLAPPEPGETPSLPQGGRRSRRRRRRRPRSEPGPGPVGPAESGGVDGPGEPEERSGIALANPSPEGSPPEAAPKDLSNDRSDVPNEEADSPNSDS